MRQGRGKRVGVLTFQFTAGAGLTRPWWIAMAGEVSQFQIADGQSYDGRLVQLAGDCCG